MHAVRRPTIARDRATESFDLFHHGWVLVERGAKDANGTIFEIDRGNAHAADAEMLIDDQIDSISSRAVVRARASARASVAAAAAHPAGEEAAAEHEAPVLSRHL